MKEQANIKNASDFLDPERTDEIGVCMINQKGHYFKQYEFHVLHVYENVVNTLPANEIESSRQNWGDVFVKITLKQFDNFMQTQLNKFFE
jgi:hypothetical protein